MITFQKDTLHFHSSEAFSICGRYIFLRENGGGGGIRMWKEKSTCKSSQSRSEALSIVSGEISHLHWPEEVKVLVVYIKRACKAIPSGRCARALWVSFSHLLFLLLLKFVSTFAQFFLGLGHSKASEQTWSRSPARDRVVLLRLQPLLDCLQGFYFFAKYFLFTRRFVEEWTPLFSSCTHLENSSIFISRSSFSTFNAFLITIQWINAREIPLPLTSFPEVHCFLWSDSILLWSFLNERQWFKNGIGRATKISIEATNLTIKTLSHCTRKENQHSDDDHMQHAMLLTEQVCRSIDIGDIHICISGFLVERIEIFPSGRER